MGAFLYIEASRTSDMKVYRLGLGCFIHPRLASLIFFFSRLV